MKTLLFIITCFVLGGCSDDEVIHETSKIPEPVNNEGIGSIYPTHSDFVHHTSTIIASKGTGFHSILEDIKKNTNGHTRFDLSCYDVKANQHLYATNSFLHGIPTPTLKIVFTGTEITVDSKKHDHKSLKKKIEEFQQQTFNTGNEPRFLLEIKDAVTYGTVYDFLDSFKYIKFEIVTDYLITKDYLKSIQVNPPAPRLTSYVSAHGPPGDRHSKMSRKEIMRRL